MRLIN